MNTNLNNATLAASIQTPTETRKKLKAADISAYFSQIDSMVKALKAGNTAPSTVQSYRSCLIIFSAWLVLYKDSVPLEKVTVDIVRDFSIFLQNTLGLRPNTVNGYLAAIRKYFLVIRGEILSKRILPDLLVDLKLPIVPSDKEVVSMIQAATDSRLLLLVALMISTGMRFTEILHRRFCDVNRSHFQIRIEKSKSRSERFVPITQQIVDVMTSYCQEYNARHPARRLRPEDYIFFDPEDPSKHLSPHKLRDIFYQIQKRAHLTDKHYTPHCMRHYAAMFYYRQKHDLLMVKNLLGHKSIASTEVYLRLSVTEEIRESYTNPFDCFFGKTTQSKQTSSAGNANETPGNHTGT